MVNDFLQYWLNIILRMLLAISALAKARNAVMNGLESIAMKRSASYLGSPNQYVVDQFLNERHRG